MIVRERNVVYEWGGESESGLPVRKGRALARTASAIKEHESPRLEPNLKTQIAKSSTYLGGLWWDV